MDRIWDRKSFEVGDHWPLWRDEKNEASTLPLGYRGGGESSDFVQTVFP